MSDSLPFKELPQVVAGVDPGATGALVALLMSGEIRYRVTFDEKSPSEIMDIFSFLANNFIVVGLFKEQYIPSFSGSSAAFSVGRHHGVLDWAIYLNKLTSREIHPKTWQSELHPAGEIRNQMKSKELSRIAGQKIFPEEDFRTLGKTGKKLKNPHLGLLEAALIAIYGLSLIKKERSLE